MLHPDLYRIIQRADAETFFVGMTTNGTLIDSKSEKRLRMSGLDTVAVSIDGIGKIHDSFRDVPGCFDRAIQGIQSLSSGGIDPQVMTVT